MAGASQSICWGINRIFLAASPWLFVLTAVAWLPSRICHADPANRGIAPLFESETRFAAEDVASNDHFGKFVSVSGDIAVVGATGSKSVYVFQKDSNTNLDWIQVAKLATSEEPLSGQFRGPVAVSADTAVVGAYGAAYIFGRHWGGANNWGEVVRLDASDADANDQFGYAVAISGDIVLVSATTARIQGHSTAGCIYVFHRNQRGPNRWGQTAKLYADDFTIETFFGLAIGFDGTTLVTRTNESTYVFRRMDARGVLWASQGKLVARDGVTGFPAAVDCDTIVGTAGTAAYIFQRSDIADTAWRELLKLTATDGVNFGNAFAIKGDSLVVGTPFSSGSGRLGVLSVYQRDFGGPDHWGLFDRVSASDTEVGDNFGTSVDIGDGDIIVGADLHTYSETRGGAAYVFTLACGNGVTDTDEQCDDGNVLGRDGCSSHCHVEEGFVCIQEPSLCFRDCNDNGIDDADDVATLISFDCNENGTPDECEDCNMNAVVDSDDLIDLTSYDCNANCIPDECEIDVDGPGSGGPFYCTLDCDPDCNQSGIPDACELVANDCDTDGVPDECETDCNENDFPDDCDVRLGTSADCNENGLPDECEISVDSFAPGGPYFCGDGCDPDCNESGVPDACELADNDCNGDGIPDECSICTECYPNTQYKVIASDAERDDAFGVAAAMSGDLAIIGAPNRDDFCSEYYSCPFGAAYIFHRDELGWRETARLTSGDIIGGTYFGVSVAISGDTAIVGAFDDDNAADSAGAAYVFRHHGDLSQWDMAAKLMPDYTYARQYFGETISIDGDTAVIGAPSTSSGTAYVFQRDWGGTDQWGQVAELSAFDAQSNDFFGRAVSITGDWAFVGAEGEDSACPEGSTCNAGAVYVFHRHEGGQDAWGFFSKVTAEDASSNAAFGASVSGDGDLLLVGAGSRYLRDAYLFRRDDDSPSGWNQIALLATSRPGIEYFGRTVSLAGDIATVGADRSVHVFHRHHGGADRWGEVSSLVPNDPKTVDSFGDALSISGQTVLVGTGSEFEPAWIGSAYFVDLRDTTCDCDCNGVLDACELGESDCNVDGILDSCQPDCNQNHAPDDCDVFEGRSVDCNGNLVPDECEISASSQAPGGPFYCEVGCDADCNVDGVPDGCQTDCNGNHTPDDCDLRDGTSQDCNSNNVPDECETDCNGNAIPDDCDLLDGSSEDCNSDDVPDECQPDCNQNGVPDVCELIDAEERDCNHNGVPDDCDTDCNQNSAPDDCEILFGFANDCNQNGVPDECEIAIGSPVPGGPFFCAAHCDPDCNNSGVPDSCELDGNDCNANLVPDECEDCNANGTPDAEDVATLVSLDCNNNCTPDECEIATASLAPGGPFYCTSDCNPDCNGTGIPDSCELGPNDCNENGRPDECEIHVDSTAPGGPFYCLQDCDWDCNGSGVPDACEFIDDDCNGDGQADVCGVIRDCDSAESWRIVPTDLQPNDRFGTSVDISGHHAIVGDAHGKVCIFKLVGDAWEEVTTLSPSVPSAYFGYPLAIHGDLAIVGSQGDGSVVGAAVVFERSQTESETWTEVARLVSSDNSTGRFGGAVDIGYDTAVVGASSFDNNRGAAYIFQRHEGGEDNWGEVARIMPSDGPRSNQFGSTVAISADRVIVGAPEDSESTVLAGAAYMFFRNEGGPNHWGQTHKIRASDAGIRNEFGSAVAISGDLAVVGSPYDNTDEHVEAAGSAYVYQFGGVGTGYWAFRRKLTARNKGRYDFFGSAVDIDRNALLVGAVGNGAAYLYQRRNDTGPWRWYDVAILSRADGEAYSDFSSAVALSGSMAILGSRRDDGACAAGEDCWAGAAHIFPLADDDCNCNGKADVCDIARHVSIDCNENRVLDACEVVSDGDYNGDGVIAVNDQIGFAQCISGPGLAPVPVSPKCVGLCLDAFDHDVDGDVDLIDWGSFQQTIQDQP